MLLNSVGHLVNSLQGLVQGKLDQKSRAFIVKYAVGRDTQNENIDSMIAKLTSWYVDPREAV